MYALAHLAYFNLENKHKLSHVETYKLIMDLLKVMMMMVMMMMRMSIMMMKRGGGGGG